MKILAALMLLGGAAAAQQPADEFQASTGVLRITPIRHASLLVQAGGQNVYIDPAQGNFDGLPKADLILITDIHFDHFVPDIIAKLRKPGTVIAGPEAVAQKLTGIEILRNGESKTFGAWGVEAVAAYNLKRGPAPGQFYHEKGRGNGYVLTWGGKRIYVAGDTEAIPEMRALRNIDIAFVPMNLPYTMTPEEAAGAVKAFKPKVVYPYHYRGTDVNVFAKALEGSGIEVRLRNWY
jgi:L-ascorbate metabolism protein UlaG (beta-lactamase superfamily)